MDSFADFAGCGSATDACASPSGAFGFSDENGVVVEAPKDAKDGWDENGVVVEAPKDARDGWDDDGDYSCFDPRTLRLSEKKGFGGKALPEDGTWKIYGGEADATAEKLVFDSTHPLLVVTKRVWDEVNYLIRRKPNYELAMFLVCRELFGTEEGSVKLVAEDLFFPKQEVSGSGVSVDAKDCRRIYADLAESERFRGGKLHRYLVHLHSHANFATFWSAVDTNQQSSLEDLGFYDDYRFYIVNNVSDEPRMAYVQYQPVLFRMDGLPFMVWDDGSKPLSEDAKRMEQLDLLLGECWKLGDTSGIWQGRLTNFGAYSSQNGMREESGRGGSWGARRFDDFGPARDSGYGSWGGRGLDYGLGYGYGYDPSRGDDGSGLGRPWGERRSWLDWDERMEGGSVREVPDDGEKFSGREPAGNWDYGNDACGKVYSFYDISEVTNYTNRKYGAAATGMFEKCLSAERVWDVERMYGSEVLRAYRELAEYALKHENRRKNVAMVAGMLQSEFLGMDDLLDQREDEFASEDNVDSLQATLSRAAMAMALKEGGDTYNVRLLLDSLE